VLHHSSHSASLVFDFIKDNNKKIKTCHTKDTTKLKTTAREKRLACVISVITQCEKDYSIKNRPG
jgi:hypothetical protein